ncbi:hypothetical protein [Natrialba sp. INN-245]|uniref:hypothetical protein n=1 Tax=Natrialba sp. INN-245 TaxID=2690967 RepID=UPI0013134FEA|nr:hypothetical protein [Natrialba sp. INN-245]MWV39894.1 hypothetical protein [Natrialba sp. INN-245]
MGIYTAVYLNTGALVTSLRLPPEIDIYGVLRLIMAAFFSLLYRASEIAVFEYYRDNV